ncbi:MAG: MYG1 family protein [Clostridia bacterium]|nr:MYG1 family protein [Clostridia bacterium]
MLSIKFGEVIITNPESANAITHAGTFNGIDVYSTALLSLVFSQVRVARVESLDGIEIHPDTIVYDIGGVYNPEKNRYDHRDSRANGWRYMTKRKTFGLLLKQFGEEVLIHMRLDKKYIKDVYESVEHYLVEAIDRDEVHSEHRHRNAMNASSEIYDFNPVENDSDFSDKAFLNAVQHAEIVLRNTIRNAIGVATGPDAIEKEIEKSHNGILAPEFFYPLQWEVHSGSRNPKRDEIYFIVYPYVTGDWWVDTTRTAWDKHMEFPKEWEGKRGDDFAEITGVADATSCDSMGLHCRAKTRAGAMRLAELAIEANNK